MQVETQAIEWPPHAWQRQVLPRPDGRSLWRVLVAGFLAGAVTATVLGLALLGPGVSELQTRAATLASGEVRGLPQEWRWERAPVRHDHMFRTVER